MSFPAPTDPGEGGSVEGAASGILLPAVLYVATMTLHQGGDPQ